MARTNGKPPSGRKTNVKSHDSLPGIDHPTSVDGSWDWSKQPVPPTVIRTESGTSPRDTFLLLDRQIPDADGQTTLPPLVSAVKAHDAAMAGNPLPVFSKVTVKDTCNAKSPVKSPVKSQGKSPAKSPVPSSSHMAPAEPRRSRQNSEDRTAHTTAPPTGGSKDPRLSRQNSRQNSFERCPSLPAAAGAAPPKEPRTSRQNSIERRPSHTGATAAPKEPRMSRQSSFERRPSHVSHASSSSSLAAMAPPTAARADSEAVAGPPPVGAFKRSNSWKGYESMKSNLRRCSFSSQLDTSARQNQQQQQQQPAGGEGKLQRKSSIVSSRSFDDATAPELQAAKPKFGRSQSFTNRKMHVPTEPPRDPLRPVLTRSRSLHMINSASPEPNRTASLVSPVRERKKEGEEWDEEEEGEDPLAPFGPWESMAALEVDKKVYSGCACDVFRARDRSSGQALAVKRYSMGSEAIKLAQLHRELTTTARLKHKHVLRPVGLVEAEGHHCLVTAWQEGGDLMQLLQQLDEGKGFAETSVVTKYVGPLLKALRHVHANDIIHRDVKPENIFLDARGDAVLGDFGLALDGQREQACMVVGTVVYMAPEVLQLPDIPRPAAWGGRELAHKALYDNKVDVWAMGVLACELLTGKVPFEGASSDETRQLILQARTSSRVGLQVRLEDAGASDQAADFVLQCLHRDPAERPSIQQLLEHPWVTGQWPAGVSPKFSFPPAAFSFDAGPWPGSTYSVAEERSLERSWQEASGQRPGPAPRPSAANLQGHYKSYGTSKSPLDLPFLARVSPHITPEEGRAGSVSPREVKLQVQVPGPLWRRSETEQSREKAKLQALDLLPSPAPTPAPTEPSAPLPPLRSPKVPVGLARFMRGLKKQSNQILDRFRPVR